MAIISSGLVLKECIVVPEILRARLPQLAIVCGSDIGYLLLENPPKYLLAMIGLGLQYTDCGPQ